MIVRTYMGTPAPAGASAGQRAVWAAVVRVPTENRPAQKALNLSYATANTALPGPCYHNGLYVHRDRRPHTNA